MFYIAYPSAADYFLNGTGRDYPQKMKRCSFSPELAEIHGDTLGMESPKIMMPKRRTDGNHIFVPPGPRYPENSFVIVKEGVAVESPEMCFLKAARCYNFHYLVEFGNCICAEYVYDGNQEYKQRRRIPITNNKLIQDFIAVNKRFLGSRHAASAARFIKNNSGSPFENRMSASYFMPKCRGGFKLVDGDLNGLAGLTEEASKYIGGHPIRCDVVWNAIKVACEYDSDMTHEGEWQHHLDAKRQTALNLSGYKIARFTRSDFSSYEAFERAVMVLWNELGMRSRKQDLMKYADIRRKVFYDLFKTKHSFFKI